jgi:hypothetical protein
MTWAAEMARILGASPERHRFTFVGPSAQQRLAEAYLALPAMDDAPTMGPSAREAWDALAVEVRRQYVALVEHGLRVIVQDADPYGSAAEMMSDVEGNRTIRVLSTASTGHHPYWSDAENDTFRAVHDVLGHAATGRGFDRHGEEAAYLCHRSTFSPMARLALTTETRGQNAAMIITGGFLDQRIAILPVDWHLASALTPTTAERTEATHQAAKFHAAAGLY